jgi:putative PIN family toxin of toxin-antitoxin system
MLKITIDTNVIVSVLLKHDSNPAMIVALILQGQIRFCLSKEIFEEYQGVLKRPKFRKWTGQA